MESWIQSFVCGWEVGGQRGHVASWGSFKIKSLHKKDKRTKAEEKAANDDDAAGR